MHTRRGTKTRGKSNLAKAASNPPSSSLWADQDSRLTQCSLNPQQCSPQTGSWPVQLFLHSEAELSHRLTDALRTSVTIVCISCIRCRIKTFHRSQILQKQNLTNQSPIITLTRLHRLHEMQPIAADVRGVCQSVKRLNSVARTVYGVIRCSLCQITLASSSREKSNVSYRTYNSFRSD